MKTVNIQEAKTHLSRLIEEVTRGEEVVIAKAGKPMVRLVPVGSLSGPRRLGLLAGQVRETEGWWAPDPELEALFYGEDEGDAASGGAAGRGPKAT